ncbi:MAG: hypothetical protein FJ042_07230 [Candidatus Cloacimonetes bacterium]|nr:hypothetical protein [Candidatus Cloacimonadota bacterium]
MLNIPAAKHALYQGFDLEITMELTFLAGNRYLLNGVNGSGKTSLLQKILLPLLLAHPERQYIIYLEQQMRGQFLALKAHAALHEYHHPLVNESDAVEYLLYDLGHCLQRQPRPVFLIIDESVAAQPIRDYWAEHRDSSCLLEVSHGEDQDHRVWKILQFTLAKVDLAQVKAI